MSSLGGLLLKLREGVENRLNLHFFPWLTLYCTIIIFICLAKADFKIIGSKILLGNAPTLKLCIITQLSFVFYQSSDSFVFNTNDLPKAICILLCLSFSLLHLFLACFLSLWEVRYLKF